MFRFWQTRVVSTDDTENKHKFHNIEWNEYLFLNDFNFDDYNYIFIYLLQVSDDGNKWIPFAYFKVKVKDLINCNFQTSPQWIFLMIDECYNLLTPSLPIPSLFLSFTGIKDKELNEMIKFTPFDMNGNIIINIKCEKNNDLIDKCLIYLNLKKIKEIINNKDPFQIELKQENISIYDQITIHRICTQFGNTVYGEITFIIADLLSISSLDNDDQQTEYNFSHSFTTNVPTVYPSTDDEIDEDDDKDENLERTKQEFMNKYVYVLNKGNGTVKFVGTTDFSKNKIVFGIEMDEAIGNSNGTKYGKYFQI